jgi:Flp pilus assembly protein TadD
MPAAPSASSSAPKSSRSKKSSNTKQPAQEDESVAMAMLSGLNYERARNWNQARRVYEEIRRKHPEHVEAAHRLGIVADAQRRHTEAEQLFLFALERQPRNPEILSDLGYCYYLQGQLAKAEAALVKATRLAPSNQRYWNNLGLVLGHQGRYDEALDCFRKSGSEADAQYNLAFVYAAQERVEDAKRCFQAALVSDPTHRRAREALASFEAYERLPVHLRDLDVVDEDGVRYVPYIEGQSQDEGQVAAGSQDTAVSSYTASRATRALLRESRGLANRNMASQRAEDLASGP